VTSGASAFAVFAIVVLGVTGRDVSWWALTGAAVVAVALHVLSRGVAGQRLILAGIGLAAVLTAVTSHLLARSTIRTAAEVLVWLNGSLSSSTWDRAADLALALAVLLPALAWLSRGLDGLALGDDTAAALGVRVRQTHLGLLVVSVALAGVATAAAGPIAFRGLPERPARPAPAARPGVAGRLRPRRRSHRPDGGLRRRQRLREVHAPSPAWLMAPSAGRVLLDGRPITDLPSKQVARTLGPLPQSPTAPEGISVAATPTRGGSGRGPPTTRAPSRLRSRRPAASSWRGGGSTSCPAVSASASGSPWRWRRTPTCCCSTSRRPTSTSPTRSRCSTCSSTSTAAAARPS
jgi:hypothetical protein